ncbi:MAG: GlsB/YeaQ/YmgE family stress response membrane protein [Actinomycetota bacterium]|nr:GlsB/YeaQ/YmgE family stress response membrane protein [Actinomycetota bacterium]
METSGIISAIVTGLVVGALARIVLPGKQPIGVVLTILVGFVGAFLGGAITAGYTQSFWITLLVQVVVATILVAVVSAFLVGRGRSRVRER